MKLFVTYDADFEARLSQVLASLTENNFQRHFLLEAYGSSISEIAINLNCHDPRMEFRRRVRFSKADNVLYTDIMLDFDLMRLQPKEVRETHVAKMLVEGIPPAIAKYKFSDFDLPRFEMDFKEYFGKIRWL